MQEGYTPHNRLPAGNFAVGIARRGGYHSARPTWEHYSPVPVSKCWLPIKAISSASAPSPVLTVNGFRSCRFGYIMPITLMVRPPGILAPPSNKDDADDRNILPPGHLVRPDNVRMPTRCTHFALLNQLCEWEEEGEAEEWWRISGF